MIVSYNELYTAVHKAFVGMRRTCGEADEVASMVASLEIVGLHGIHHFNKASAFINMEEDRPADIMQHNNKLQANLNNCSVACHLPTILDYAIEQVGDARCIEIELRHCHNRWLAYNELAKLSDLGFACCAYWSNGSSPERTLYVLNQSCRAPEIFLSDKGAKGDCQQMTILLSRTDFEIGKLSGGYSIHIDSAELIQAYDAAWQTGVTVDDTEWHTLLKAGKAMLVENSERSIMGAGEMAEESPPSS